MFITILLEENIIQIILGIIALPIIVYALGSFMMLFYAGAAKVTGKNIKSRGRIIARPDTLEVMRDKFKDDSQAAIRIVRNIKNPIPIYDKNKLKEGNVNEMFMPNKRIENLSKLESLYKNGTITKEEFDLLKMEVLLGIIDSINEK